MKVLLIQPPATYPSEEEQKKHRLPILPPLGLMYLAAVLERDTDHSVWITDAYAEDYWQKKHVQSDCSPWLKDQNFRYGLTDKALHDRIRHIKPDVVGVTTLFTNRFLDFHNVFAIAKCVDPNIVTVAGGPHFTVFHEEDMKDKNIDVGVIHEGEVPFPRLLERLDGVPLKEIAGLISRDQEDGRPFLEKPAQFLQELSHLPFPARHLVPPPSYYSRMGTGHGSHTASDVVFATMIASRGCPYHCSFCSAPIVMGQTMRYRSPQDFCDEIEFLRDVYGVKQISVEDDDFNAIKPRFKEMLREMDAREMGVGWHAPNGLLAAGIDQEVADLMVKTGCNSVSLGLESGNERVLHQLIHKPVALEHVPKAVKWLRERGIRVMLFLIVGTPGEKQEEVYDTWEYAKQCNADWYGVHIFTPLPGTAAWTECKEKGYVDAELDLSKLKYSVGNVRTPWIEPDWLEEIQQKMNIDLNFVDNTNTREGNFLRARDDFARVVRLYPHIQYAQEALARTEKALAGTTGTNRTDGP